MINVVSVKFKGGGKSYFFDPGDKQYEKGVGVIVETSKGLEYATVCEGVHGVQDDQVVLPLMPVVRLATQKDLDNIAKNEERKPEAMKIVREKIEGRKLDMKPVDCEFSFDGTKIVIYFTSDNRVDFRELIKDLSSAFHMRIELRQIGIREEIKLMGGLAPCGRECCCVKSLQEPKKVSVKMAKNQGLSLNPSKISGLCGRLMCCLAYENDYYCEACKKVPKVGGEANTPDGTGVVVNVNMLSMTVKVKIEHGESVSYKDYSVDDISFMRGNEVVGTVAAKQEEVEEKVVEEDLPPVKQQPEKREKFKEKRNNQNGKQNQEGAKNQGGKNQNGKNHGDNQNGNRHGENGQHPKRQKQPQPEQNKKQQGEQNKKPNQGATPNDKAQQGGQPNFNRNRKKHHNNKNRKQKGGEGAPNADKPKNNG